MTQSTPQNSTNLFKTLEKSPAATQVSLEQVMANIPWNSDGLIPAIAQDYQSQQVLMLAWVNACALQQSLTSGKATYYSRSRQALWCKGESSGHVQKIINIALDCDGDALLFTVDQLGPACHTLRPHCFYWNLTSNGAEIV